MAFADYMRNSLNPTASVSKDMEWYIKATAAALNKWMVQLEGIFNAPTQAIDGTLVTWAGVSSALNLPAGGYFRSNLVRFSDKDVKDAMWCGDPNQSFINLFELVGNKIRQNFDSIWAAPAITGPAAKPMFITTHFIAYGAQLIAWAKARGAEMNAGAPALTPEEFLQHESDLLLQAVQNIPTAPTVLTGVTPLGVFTGTVNASLAMAQ